MEFSHYKLIETRAIWYLGDQTIPLRVGSAVKISAVHKIAQLYGYEGY